MARPSYAEIQRKRALAARHAKKSAASGAAQVHRLKKDNVGLRKFAGIQTFLAGRQIRAVTAAASERAKAAADANRVLHKIREEVNDVMLPVILRGLQYEALVDQRSTGAAPPVGFRPLELTYRQWKFISDTRDKIRGFESGPLFDALVATEEMWSPFEEMATPWPADVPAWIDGVSPAVPAPPPPVKLITPTPLANPWRKIKTEPVDGNWAPLPMCEQVKNEERVGGLSMRTWVNINPPSNLPAPLPIDPSIRMLKGGSLTDTDTDSESDSDWDEDDCDLEIEFVVK